MDNGENADPEHGSSQTGLNDTVAETDDEEEEEGERVSTSIEYRNDEHEDFGAERHAVAVLVVVESPC